MTNLAVPEGCVPRVPLFCCRRRNGVGSGVWSFLCLVQNGANVLGLEGRIIFMVRVGKLILYKKEGR